MTGLFLKLRRTIVGILGRTASKIADPYALLKENLIYDQKFNDAFQAIEERRFIDAVGYFLIHTMSGDAAAQNNLGVMYEMANPRRDDLAEENYRKAATQGLDAAQYNLAAILAADIMLYADQHSKEARSERIVEAYMWLLKANAQNYARAHDALPRLREHMTEEQIEKAYEMASIS